MKPACALVPFVLFAGACFGRGAEVGEALPGEPNPAFGARPTTAPNHPGRLPRVEEVALQGEKTVASSTEASPARPGQAFPPAPAQDLSWQSDPYRPPSFETFFPDDPEAGERLDELVRTNALRQLEPAAHIAAVRQGLRHTSNHRTNILRELGNRFIWGKSPQHPGAIELCYHAADFSEEARRWGTRHYAVYFGLSVVSEKTPAILRTLTDLCVAVDDPNDIGRVAWGAASQRDELLPFLEPHLASEDPWVREKAKAVQRIFRGELEAFAWAAQRAKEPPRPRPWKEMPAVRRALSEGTTAERLAMLDRISREALAGEMNDSYLADFARCAEDPDPAVRERVARLVGNHWIWTAGLHRLSDQAVDLLLRLSRDDHAEVRSTAIYHGLSTYRGEREDVVRRLVELAGDPAEARSRDRLVWGLERHGELLRGLLEADLSGPDATRARRAYELHRAVFDERPAIVPAGIAGPKDLIGTWDVTLLAGGHENLRLPPFTLVADEVGSLQLEGAMAEGYAGDPFEDFTYAEVGETLYLSFLTRVEGAVLRTSAKLSEGRLEGISRLDGTDRMIVWTATR